MASARSHSELLMCESTGWLSVVGSERDERNRRALREGFPALDREGLESQTRKGTLQSVAGSSLRQQVACPSAKSIRFPVAKAARTEKFRMSTHHTQHVSALDIDVGARERAGLHDPGRHRAGLQVNGARDDQPDPEVSVLGRFKTRDETVFTKGRTADQDGRCPDLRCDRKRLFAADCQNASQMPGLRIGKWSGALAIGWLRVVPACNQSDFRMSPQDFQLPLEFPGFPVVVGSRKAINSPRDRSIPRLRALAAPPLLLRINVTRSPYLKGLLRDHQGCHHRSPGFRRGGESCARRLSTGRLMVWAAR